MYFWKGEINVPVQTIPDLKIRLDPSKEIHNLNLAEIATDLWGV